MKGKLIVISGLSGAGKGTVASELVKDKDFVLSISATTRDKRNGEIDKVHYFFKTKDEFKSMIEKGELLEYAEYVGNFYGTPKAYIDENLSLGKNVILEIEMQGAMQIKEKYKDSLLVFITCKSAKVLYERLKNRGRENEDQIKKRLMQAATDAKYAKDYDYIIVNDNLPDTMTVIGEIVDGTYDKTHNEENIKILNKLINDIEGGNYV